jgi:uncharacterized membrane protein YjjP (DUF1212 family)
MTTQGADTTQGAGQEQAAESPPADGNVGFVLALARALHHHGYPANLLEQALERVCARLGLRGQFFSVPTALFASFGADGDQRTHLLRLLPASVELDKLVAVDAVRRAVVAGVVEPGPATDRIREIESAPVRYGPRLTTLGYALAAGATARFIGGGPSEIVLATLIGVAIGLLAWVALRASGLGRLFEAVAAALAAGMAIVWTVAVGPASTTVVTIAGLVILIPGLTLTVAITELATSHLAAGTARLTGALIVFLSMGFGVALGRYLATLAVGLPADYAGAVALPGWTEAPALLAWALGTLIVLRAAPRELPWVFLAGVVALQSTRLGVSLLGPGLGAFLAALLVGVASNWLARRRQQPASVTLVPAILLLVPGSFGLRSVGELLERQTLAGLETAFSMVLIAVALAMGLLLANILEPRSEPRAAPL